MEVKICLHCGAPFNDEKGSGYCVKKKCQQRRKWDVVREAKGFDKLENRICLNCGKEFKPRASNQQNCSSDCGDEHRRKYRYPEKAKEIGAKYRERKLKRVENMLAGRTFAQALAEKYNLDLGDMR